MTCHVIRDDTCVRVRVLYAVKFHNARIARGRDYTYLRVHMRFLSYRRCVRCIPLRVYLGIRLSIMRYAHAHDRREYVFAANRFAAAEGERNKNQSKYNYTRTCTCVETESHEPIF